MGRATTVETVLLLNVLLVASVVAAAPAAAQAVAGRPGVDPAAGQSVAVPPAADLFATHERCLACHVSRDPQATSDVPIAGPWSASMMANAARDPYWQGSVRAETLDHPSLRAAIEDKCSTCHMPMARFAAAAHGGAGRVFASLGGSGAAVGSDSGGAPSAAPGDLAHLAMDGVSCSLCHQVTAERFGERDGFDGGFVVDTERPKDQRVVYGPYDVDAGRARVMRSSSEFVPEQAPHLKESELCGTCHTLFTHYVDPRGGEGGEFPEQMPYLEWLHSGYRETKSCQDCHMPEVAGDVPVSTVLPKLRPEVSRHAFRGGNRYMLSLFDRYREELGVVATPNELERAIDETGENLAGGAARVRVEDTTLSGGILTASVMVENLAGHKLPSAYPSRRVWLHFTAREGSGRVVFESGALEPDGSIVGNDNDTDASRFEPHYDLVERADQVQIYEPIIVDATGAVTTGLLWGAAYVKDNRLLPLGFDAASADDAVAVRGAAGADTDFAAGGDRVRYRVPVQSSAGPLTIEVELRYQSIGFRWARNLGRHAAAETSRFLDLHDATGGDSAFTLAHDRAEVAVGR